MYTIEMIFEFMWACETDKIDSKPIDDLVKELGQISRGILNDEKDS